MTITLEMSTVVIYLISTSYLIFALVNFSMVIFGLHKHSDQKITNLGHQVRNLIMANNRDRAIKLVNAAEDTVWAPVLKPVLTYRGEVASEKTKWAHRYAEALAIHGRIAVQFNRPSSSTIVYSIDLVQLILLCYAFWYWVPYIIPIIMYMITRMLFLFGHMMYIMAGRKGEKEALVQLESLAQWIVNKDNHE